MAQCWWTSKRRDVAEAARGQPARSSRFQITPAGSSSLVVIRDARHPKPQTASTPSLIVSRPKARSIGFSLIAAVMNAPRPASVAARYSVCDRCPASRSEEHTSELQSQSNLVCRLLLEKKKKISNRQHPGPQRKRHDDKFPLL